ncbi:hypothetical protein [Planococcus salinus]|uniref:Uncharacterized protein n=1 Tax=Planococcus salinus TaxID=1848460 RepID=A0A3M8PA51_9BACL|nr:hypothetical protein [Planococcus salinus]RNF40074.1 hypothetical protein EEX84_05395 [Planococcus salinus]
MADWRQRIKTISSTKGDSAPESAKRTGIGCLTTFVLIVSILTFLITFGLFQSGSWGMAFFSAVFAVLSIATLVILLLPQKTNKL